MLTATGFGVSWSDVGNVAKAVVSPTASAVKQAATAQGKGYLTAAQKKAYASVASSKTVQSATAYKKAADTYLATEATGTGSPVQQNAAKRLQAALVSLGKIAKSPTLSAIKVDGAIGPKVAAAVNLTFTKHIGAGQAAAQYRTGKMPVAYIKANANGLAEIIEREIARRGGTTASPAVVTQSAANRTIVDADTATSANPQGDARALQAALAKLGSYAKNASLKAIKVDGAPGAKTVAAVNVAFVRYIGKRAPANLRTGKLTLAYVKSNAAMLAMLIEKENTLRAANAATVLKAVSKPIAVKTKKGKVVKATKVSTKAGETYKIEDEETGDTHYSSDPTDDAPNAPANAPAPSEEQVTAAAEAAAASGATGQPTAVSPSQISPDDAVAATGGESFFSKNKWLILGGVAAVAVAGVGITIMKKRNAGARRLSPVTT